MCNYVRHGNKSPHGMKVRFTSASSSLQCAMSVFIIHNFCIHLNAKSGASTVQITTPHHSLIRPQSYSPNICRCRISTKHGQRQKGHSLLQHFLNQVVGQGPHLLTLRHVEISWHVQRTFMSHFMVPAQSPIAVHPMAYAKSCIGHARTVCPPYT